VFTARQALRAATIEGAKTLMWDDEIGSLEIGKKADFVLFDLDHVEWTPFYDPLQALVFSASSASIVETWVDGKALYRDGRVQTVDEREIRRKARELAAAAIKRAGLDRQDIPTTTALYDTGN
jgi:cytosine/adenosine deaminase-related metal-dependent hydrolase